MAPAHQPASHPAGESEDHEDEDSDCRKLREHDYDDAEEKAELEEECAEAKAEDHEDGDDDRVASGSGSHRSGGAREED